MNELPKPLKDLVRFALSELGASIQEIYGSQSFKLIEDIRKEMASLRSASDEKSYQVLKKERQRFRKLSDDQLSKINHGFSLYMELVNRCEKAYRRFRLRGHHSFDPGKKIPENIIFVFTAHPTEARSKSFLTLINDIEEVLLERLNRPNNKQAEILRNLMGLALSVSLAETKKPKVVDEAENLFQVTLRAELIEKQIALKRMGVNVQFRTWVGGDKDGHPLVDEKTMLESWNHSRSHLLSYCDQQMGEAIKRVALLPKEKTQSLVADLSKLQKSFKSLYPLKKNDGERLSITKKILAENIKKYKSITGCDCIQLLNINDLYWIYPAMVLPLEIREDSELVHETKTKPGLSIEKMLKQLGDISGGVLTKWYVRGFVMSMSETVEDIEAGLALVKKTIGDTIQIPVVPLFETRFALENSGKILTELFNKHPKLVREHQKIWNGKFEIMLGYSDSSKESGVYTSRLLIANTLNKLAPVFKKFDLRPVYFHGSGGSIERGGGSIKDQTDHWPKEALNIYKTTIQGEMVSRNFGNPSIMESTVEKIVENFSDFKTGKNQLKEKILSDFSEDVSKKYGEFIGDPDFKAFLSGATPYTYLDQLKIGSRPTKRNTGSNEIKLRAIPWVLCWTQTRTLFPTWWGVGSTWKSWDHGKRYEFMKLSATNTFLATYLKILSFTLSKIELPVFWLYLEENLPKQLIEKYQSLFQEELELTKVFLKEMTGAKELMWFRPWLKESVELRSSMIHPLNLVQMEALRRENPHLLRESVTGIACGMLTTG